MIPINELTKFDSLTYGKRSFYSNGSSGFSQDGKSCERVSCRELSLDRPTWVFAYLVQHFVSTVQVSCSVGPSYIFTTMKNLLSTFSVLQRVHALANDQDD